MNGQTNGRMDGWLDGQMDGHTDVQIPTVPLFYGALSPPVPSGAAALLSDYITGNITRFQRARVPMTISCLWATGYRDALRIYRARLETTKSIACDGAKLMSQRPSALIGGRGIWVMGELVFMGVGSGSECAANIEKTTIRSWVSSV